MLPYHPLAGGARALRDEKGTNYPKLVMSTFMAYKGDN
jgi:hypothetical protein